jgi:hypothetical protein
MLFYKAMKKILIVEVPDSLNMKNIKVGYAYAEKFANGAKAGSGLLKFTEFTPPTDEEIEKENFTEGDEYAEQSYLLAEGAKWFKSLLT